MEQGYWFRATRFQVIRGEDGDTGPGIYGRQLASWLRDQLVAAGYRDAEVQAESWGWCVLVTDNPCLLWIGCGGVLDDEDADEGTPVEPINGSAVLWHCHAVAELSWLRRWWARGDAESAQRKLDLTLRGLLLAEPEIQLVDPPA